MSEPDRTAPERILIVRLSHLGDVVLALCVYHALRAAHPDARIRWAVQPEFAELVAGLPGVERAVRFGRRDGPAAWWRLRSELGEFRPDLAVDCQGNLKSAAVTLLSGAGRRAGPARADWREPAGVLVLNDPAPAASRSGAPSTGAPVHAMERMLTLARHVAPGHADPPRTDPALSPQELARGEEHLAGLLPGAGLGGVLLLLSPPDDVRSWSEDAWAELALTLADEGREVLLISGPAEEARGRRLAARLAGAPRVFHRPGQRGLRELAALFAAAGSRGALAVACDSGPMHLAAACGVPVLCLEGPQDGRRTGPWPLAGAPELADSPPEINRGLARHALVRASHEPDCAPCLARRCTHPEGAVCMERIRPGDVARELVALAGASGRSAP